MNAKYLMILLLMVGCGGRLSDEQRKKMKESMELNQVRKVSDAQVTDEAYRQGREIAAILETKDKTLSNEHLMDSLQQMYDVEIISMTTSDSLLRSIEKRIIEAYSSSTEVASLGDNIQKMGADTLLYTKPLMIQREDGAVAFSKALGIRMLKKKIILSIKE
jgi:hypothetical protein